MTAWRTPKKPINQHPKTTIQSTEEQEVLYDVYFEFIYSPQP
jgi:hypothetical protein